MKSLRTKREQTASFRILNLLLAVAPLWLMLTTTTTSAYAQTSNPSPGDWTEFHRANMQRWNPYETLLGVKNVGSLQLKWKYATGLFPDYGTIRSSAAVANGVVYVGSSDYNLYAISASTGAKLWSYPLGAEVESSPAVANGVVYVGSRYVYALNASSGALLWSYAPEDFFRESSPAVVNGVVYIGSSSGTVYALNASTGAKLWSYTTGNAVSSPAVVNGVVYIGSYDENVYAINASTGTKLWSYATGAGVNSSPAVANRVVYIGTSDGNIYALNAVTGVKMWSFTTTGAVESSPAVANGVVYVGDALSYYFGGHLYALNASTGALLWSYAIGNAEEFGSTSSVVASPAVANGVVYVNSTDLSEPSNLYAFNANTGAKLWSYADGNAEENFNSSPAIVDGVVYIVAGGDSGDNVYAFSMGAADLFLRIRPTLTTVHQGDLITYAFPVWNLGPDNADQEVLNTQVPEGTVFDYIRISGTPGLGTCSHTPYLGAGPISIVCHENSVMALNTTWTVRLTVKVTAPAGTVITESAATMADNPDPNLANNKATVSLTVVP
jgi:outer membrane protein assembly factor BamB